MRSASHKVLSPFTHLSNARVPPSTESKLASHPDNLLETWLTPKLLPLADLRTCDFMSTWNPRNLPAAGVMIPIVDRATGPTLLFTIRSKTLSKHAGQISFPGGRVDDRDADIVATALRECWEETGITADFVMPIGGVEPVESITGFLMVPTVAIIREGFTALANPGEVDTIFEVPFTFVTDPANHTIKSGTISGATREFYSIVWKQYDIWGATARILVNLSQHLTSGTHDLSF